MDAVREIFPDWPPIASMRRCRAESFEGVGWMSRVPFRILVVEDEVAISEVLETRLTGWGHEVLLAGDRATALRLLESGAPNLILSDVRLPDGNGVELIEAYRSLGAGCPVVLMTAFGTIDVAVEAMKRGASDFLTKPLDYTRLRAIIDRLVEEAAFQQALSPAAEQDQDGLGALVGRSAAMKTLFGVLRKVAATDASVFITGESGTGKEVVARSIHALGRRAKAPFVALNMAALPAGVIEAELFGHTKGSFTGAVSSRPGAFELAHGGTLFLDEIAEMPMELQPKLLRVLEDGRIRPIGARQELQADARILAATNRPPEVAIAEGRLRQDLFYRLNVFTVTLPPLRERPEDIPLLAEHFRRQVNEKHGTSVAEFERDVLEALASHPWPGNIRELRNVVERAIILAQSGVLRRDHLPPAFASSETSRPAVVLPIGVTAAEAERILILETLRLERNNKAAAARRLGIDVKTIRNKLKAYGLPADAE
jgi:DNA-binding NtrC family response regulator